MNRHRLALLAALAAIAAAGNAGASCGQAFCVVNTNWAMQGVPADPGSSRLDLHYEYIDQNRLWRGSHGISAAESDSDTLEQRTLNHNLVATYDYALSDAWAFSLSVPVQKRIHEHIADPAGDATPERWDFTRLGDIKVTGSYRITDQEDPLNHFGLLFGVKLPTGSHTVANDEGAVAERALQPGTGSTDAIVGAYYTHRGFAPGSAWFAQGTRQQAVATRDQFRPGSTTSLTLGYTQPVSGPLSATLQANALIRSRDTGDQAEPELSGGRYVFVSPGLSYALSKSMQVYGYAQLPVYRYVNGIQLAADRAFVVGTAFQF